MFNLSHGKDFKNVYFVLELTVSLELTINDPPTKKSPYCVLLIATNDFSNMFSSLHLCFFLYSVRVSSQSTLLLDVQLFSFLL